LTVTGWTDFDGFFMVVPPVGLLPLLLPQMGKWQVHTCRTPPGEGGG
jgi:hypothetical protein